MQEVAYGKSYSVGDTTDRVSPFDSLSEAVKLLASVNERLESLADRIAGSKPEANAKGGEIRGVPSGLIGIVESSTSDLHSLSEAMSRSINRIESRL